MAIYIKKIAWNREKAKAITKILSEKFFLFRVQISHLKKLDFLSKFNFSYKYIFYKKIILAKQGINRKNFKMDDTKKCPRASPGLQISGT